MQKPDTEADPLNLLTQNSLETWRQLCPSVQSIDIPDKGVLYRQGDACPHVFLIEKGIIKLSHITEQGNEWTIALLKQGDMLGCLQSGVGTKAMEESAQAIGQAALVRFERDDFKTLAIDQPALLWQMFETQCFRRHQAERKLLSILAQPLENRVIAMLKELAGMFGIRCAHGYALEIQLTQQELADLVGASRPVISTIMNDLRNRGILDYTRELICVKDGLYQSQ